MTPVPFDLPLRPAEAARLAQLIFEQAERKPLTDEIRTRLAARAAVLRLESITPWLGSLVRDPVHPSTYYVAVDADGGVPLLLHMAAAAAPTGSIFPKALLIGRVRLAGSEAVINAVPFGPSDEENLEKFAFRLDTAFLPKPQGPRQTVAFAPAHPARDLPAAFEVYRGILKRTGRNTAHLAAVPGGPPAREVWLAGLWSAVRAGWREGYSLGIEVAVRSGEVEAAEETLRQAAAFSSFVLDIADLSGGGIAIAANLHGVIRQAKTARSYGKSFDFELSAAGLSGQDFALCLESLKARGIACQPRGSRLLGTVREPDEIASLSGTMARSVT